MRFYSNLLFLLFLPLSCEGITLKMPAYTSMNSEMRVTCQFGDDHAVTTIVLHHGDTKSVAVYNFDMHSFVSNTSLEIGARTSIFSGSLTFVFKSVTCNDFTFYMCTIDYDSYFKSQNQTLQVTPEVVNIQPGSQKSVNELSTFTCEGIVRKKGSYSVKWYRTSINASNWLRNSANQIISENQCSRRVVSTLTYNIRESDVPNFLLWCQLKSGPTVEKSANFTTLGAGSDYKGDTILVVMVSFLAAIYHLF